MTYNVYALSTDGKTFRYVGATKYIDVNKRAKQFMAQRFQNDTPINCWIRDEVSAGMKIIATLLEGNCADSTRKREDWWITYLRAEGHDLLNVMGGGRVNYSRPDSWNRGKKTGPRSPETKEKLSIAQRGKPAWNRGIPMTEEAKDKLRGRVFSKESRAKMRASRLRYVEKMKGQESNDS